MSTYGKYIEEALKTKYSHIKKLRNSKSTQIDLFEHVESNKKLVCIKSENRNDHIFRLLLNTRCDNLPTIYEACSCESYLLVLEEYVDGRNLSDILAEKPLPAKTALKYFSDICNGLSSLHGLNIIHRDIKPENIIIDKNDNAVLIDLQAARLTTDGQKKDTVNLGTVGYAAPEQYGVYQSSPPTDIYALGVLLNEMLLNSHPSVKTPSGRLGKIIHKCTDTQISKRYQTVKSLMTDIKKVKRL